MTISPHLALARAPVPDTAPRADAGAALRRRVRALRDEAVSLWASVDPAPAFPGGAGRAERRANARALGAFLPDLEQLLRDHPRDAALRPAWRERLRAWLRRRGAGDFALPSAYLGPLLSDESFEVTRAFTRAARVVDPGLPVEDVFQALRNVWIANSLQVLLARPVALTPGLLGYSLLYPFTDNHLDDPGVPRRTKECAWARFGRRLAGEPLPARTPLERKAFACVALVEEQWPRSTAPLVFDSLLAIHHAQRSSLAQAHGPSPAADELVALSVAKGGTSVLADGYLVAGELAPEVERFTFLYGVLLQLLDDLQDLARDRAAGQRTLFSTAAGGELSRRAARLCGFAHAVDAAARALDLEGASLLSELVRKNATWLFLTAVAHEPRRFEARFLRRLEERSPFHLGDLRRATRDARRRHRRVGRHLARTQGLASPLEVLG